MSTRTEIMCYFCKNFLKGYILHSSKCFEEDKSHVSNKLNIVFPVFSKYDLILDYLYILPTRRAV